MKENIGKNFLVKAHREIERSGNGDIAHHTAYSHVEKESSTVSYTSYKGQSMSKKVTWKN